MPSVINVNTELLDYSESMLRDIDGATVQHLKDSIQAYGILQPLVVCRKEGRFMVICGNHRLCAAKGLGLLTVPVIVRNPLNRWDIVFWGLAENTQRLEMNPIREGELFKRMTIDMPKEEIARHIQKSLFYVEIRILIYEKLHADLKQHVGKRLTLSNAVALARLPKLEQIAVWDKLVETVPESTKSYGKVSGFCNPSKKGPFWCICKKCGSRHLRGVNVNEPVS